METSIETRSSQQLFLQIISIIEIILTRILLSNFENKHKLDFISKSKLRFVLSWAVKVESGVSILTAYSVQWHINSRETNTVCPSKCALTLIRTRSRGLASASKNLILTIRAPSQLTNLWGQFTPLNTTKPWKNTRSFQPILSHFKMSSLWTSLILFFKFQENLSS